MKNFFVRELFWFVLTFVMSLILSLIFMELSNLTSSSKSMMDIEKVFTVQLYIIGCIVSFISIYIVRIIVIAIKKYFI